VDYGGAQKVYDEASAGQRRYGTAESVTAKKRVITSAPDGAKISTDCVERQNLTTPAYERLLKEG
jgi:hypothetical protein